MKIVGCGFVSNQYKNLCLEFIFQKKETCLLQKISLDHWLKSMEKRIVYTDGGTWYPQACNFLGLKHYLHTSLEKSLIERVMQYFKDRTECFDDYYPCVNTNCDLSTCVQLD